MSHLRKRTFALPLLFLVVLAALLVVLAFATRADTAPETATVLTESQVTQRALALAQTDFKGAPSKITVQSSTIGQSHVVQCGALGGWVSTFTESLRGRPNWCAPDTGIWVVTLQGDFQTGNVATDTLTVVMDTQGTMMQINSGELAEIGTGD